MSFDLEQILEKIASEKFSTKQEQDAFKDAFLEKAAGSLDSITGAPLGGFFSNPALRDGAMKALGALGVGIAGAALAKGVFSTSNAIGNSFLRTKFEAALASVMNSNRIVKASPERARQYAETIFKFAPHVATDPNLLSSILSNVVQGEGVDPMTIKTLVDLESKYGENNSFRNIPKF